MLLTKNTPTNTLIDGEPIFIDKEVSLDSKLLEFLFENFPNSKITISTFSREYYSSLRTDVLYNEDELQLLVSNANIADKYNRELTFDDEYSLEQAIIASRKMNDNADYINKIIINGEPLSPLEKFTLAYSIVVNKKYLEDTENISNSRNIISTLSGDKIVCSGYANELVTLCERIGVPCAYRLNSFGENENIDNHATCIINIQDSKYGINGIYVADPTADAKTANCDKNSKMHHCYRHFLLTHNEYQSLKPNNRFDKAIIIKNNPESGFVDTPIQTLQSLYPQSSTSILNTSFLDPHSHKLNFDEVKKALKINISNTLPKQISPSTLNTKQSLDESIDRIIALHLAATLSKKSFDNFMPLINSCYASLNPQICDHNMAHAIYDKVDKISNQDLLNTYLEYLQYEQEEYHLSEFQARYTRDLNNSKPIQTQTIKKLFNTVFDQVINLPHNEIKKLADFHAKAREDSISPANSQLTQ